MKWIKATFFVLLVFTITLMIPLPARAQFTIEVSVQRYHPENYFLGIDVMGGGEFSDVEIFGLHNPQVLQPLQTDHIVVSLSERPNVGDTYAIRIHYAGTFEDKTYSVDGINDNFAQITSPPDGSSVSTTTPTFLWQEANNINSYHLKVVDDQGNWIWEHNFPVGTSSCDYNFDGGATASLQSGKTYEIVLHTFDANGNQATTQSTFTLQGLQDVFEESISDTIQTGDFRWDSAYDISYRTQTVTIDLDLQLVGDDPGDALRQQWEEGIEGIWSNRYDIIDGIFTYPIVFNVDWVDSDPHHTVTVHSGTDRTNMLNWYTDRPGGWSNDYQDEIAAHEAGHMFGLYDEYPGGALDPNTNFTTTNSLMADLGQLWPRHYQGILEWLEGMSNRDLSLANSPLPPYLQNDPIDEFRDPMTPIPEPSTLSLIVFGLFSGIIIINRYRRKM